MENKNVVVFEDKIERMPVNKNSSFKNSIIDGSGSEPSLKSINSQPKEILESSNSSLNPVGQSNSFHNSMENNNIKGNEKSALFNNTIKMPKINKFEDSVELKIYKNELGGSIDESSLHFINENKKANISDPTISQKNTNNGNMQIEDMQNLKDKTQLDINQKMREGLIPFFVKVKGYKTILIYGKPTIKLRQAIEHYIKKRNSPIEIKNTFFYKNELIDFNNKIGEIGIEPLSVISDD